MSQTKSVAAPDQGQSSQQEPHPKPPEVATLLSSVEALLQKGEPKKALDLIGKTRSESPWTRNAVGVCQLRLGNASFAVDIFRGLAIDDKAFGLRDDAPVVFKTNFATAMLLAGNMEGCLNVLRELRKVQHPAVEKLQGAIHKWTETFSFIQKVMWWLGSSPARPVFLDYPPGDL